MPADLINPTVRARAGDYAGKFQSAEPFRHVSIDDFLTPAAAERLLAQFPAVADPAKLLNEFGEPNPKSAVSDVARSGRPTSRWIASFKRRPFSS